MNVSLRRFGDTCFTVTAVGSVLLLTAALVIILGPMIVRGATAIVFQGTIEFRQMQLTRHGRGDPAAVARQVASTNEARRPLYQALDEFKRGIDTACLEDEARQVYTELGKQLRNRNLPAEQLLTIRRHARHLRDTLVDAFEATDKAEARRRLLEVLAESDDPGLAGTVGERLFAMARDYQAGLDTLDLGQRQEYATALKEVQEALRKLLGPRPGEPTPPLAMNRYGATRMDLVERWEDDLLYGEKWVQKEPGKPLVKVRINRETEQFQGTRLASLFRYWRENRDAIMEPAFTVYWQYLIDDSVPGHFFGGVGPEILGTLVITVLAIAFAFPLGLVSAAYLVEVAGDNVAVRFIRMCINTLAGVPSIAFGLFGLAFFVGTVMDGVRCVLAASLTLGVLALPVVIRASEEAIRSVPSPYKEAALALGASRLRCFVTVQLPAALPGILTGVILSMSRAAGETAPILFTGAVAVGPALWEHPVWDWAGQQTRALSYGAFDLASNDRIAAMVPHQQFGMVMTLVVLVLLLNGLAIILRWRISRKLRGR